MQKNSKKATKAQPSIKTQQTTKEIINNVVWKACDSFRGTMDSSDYKDYILTLLFIKYLSDFYKEKLEDLDKEHKGNKARIKEALKSAKFKLDETCTFDYLLKHKENENLGQIMNEVLGKIESFNQEKLQGIFRSIDFNNANKLGNTKERNAILRHLLEDFNDERLNLRPSMLENSDCLGDTYEYLIAHFASDAGKKGGEFYTPAEVSSLLAKLVAPKAGDMIYDPTCGSGSLLIKAAKEMRKHERFRLYGQEKNGQTAALCKMNMFLHEIEDSIIEWGDTIRNPLHLQDNALKLFDKVVANPPFSLDKWGEEEAKQDIYSRFKLGIPPKGKGDYAFILHMISSLKDKGTMGVILPHGVLFRGASEGAIRKKLIEQNLLDSVIGLPANLFFGTSIPACILIFKKGKKDKNVLFIDASKDYEKSKNQNKLRAQDINKILSTYKKREDVPKYAHVASLDEIAKNDYNLNIPRYVDSFEEEQMIDLAATKQEILRLERELSLAQKQFSKSLQELGL